MNGIKFAFPTETKDVIVRWYKNVAPGVVTTSDPFQPPHTNHVLMPENIQSVAYTFEFWTTDDGVTPLSFLTSWAIDGEQVISGQLEGFFHYVVGRGDSGEDPAWADPAPGDTELHDERLAGQKYVVVMRGTGPRRPDEVPELSTGGFSFAHPDETFQQDDTITVLLLGSGGGSSSGGSGSASAEGYKVITAGGAIDDTYYGKHVLAKPAGLITTLTFPAFETIPAGTVMTFSTNGFTAANRYLALQFAGGDTVPFWGKDRDVIHLGSHEFLKLLFYQDGANIRCLVMEDGTNYKRVGERLTSDYTGKPNTVLADGEVEYTVADFPRLFSELTPDQQVSYNTWGAAQQVTVAGNALTKYPNKRKFGISPDGQKFRFPDRRGMTMRVLDSFTGAAAGWLSQGPGGFSSEELIGHTHTVPIKGMNLENQGSTGNDYSGSGSSSLSLPSNSTGGTAQRVDSEGVYALIGI